MCLLVLAWMSHPQYRLIVAGNRDEFHDRPAAPLAWWDDVSGILAGRDLRAGGTWLGVARSGHVGLVTNFRDAEPAPLPDAPSRGQLVPQFLRDGAAPGGFLDRLHPTARRFAGFNLLVADATTLHYYTNVGDERPRALSPGIFGLSNHRLDEPWPKLVRTRERFAAAVSGGAFDAAGLLDLLADRTPAVAAGRPAGSLPPELERALSAPFVLHPRYGTRCSTVLTVAHDGRTVVLERRYDAAGAQTGATRIEFPEPAA